ncbi:MAG: hypothetical protein U0R24_07750 [Solirubrobacterales bacterium]
MTRGRGVLIATVLVALAAAGTATAVRPTSEARLSGHVRGDDESIVRLTVAYDKNFDAKVAKRFRFKKINATCDGAAQRISIKLSGRVPFEDGAFARTFSGSGGDKVKIEGAFNNGGRLIGLVRAPQITIDGLGACKVAPSEFKVS